MGPRLVSRGNYIGGWWFGLHFDAFNGAAAREPRKSLEINGRPARCRPFNGAAAREPRKSLSPRAGQPLPRYPSMGPRLVSRGNHSAPIRWA